jgi:ubiquinone/menaquinone biosynthesis C-methylase UbiE
MTANINKEIYDKNYSSNDYLLDKSMSSFDKTLISIRFSFIEKWGFNKEILDLCCGSGSYLIPVLNQVKTAVGVDFSSKILNEFKQNLNGLYPTNLSLIQADALQIPLKNNSIDFVYSYCSLYTIQNVESVISEVSRTLRPGGYASLELGNLYSFNTPIVLVHHKKHGWAKSYHIPVSKMYEYFRENNLEVVEHRSFLFLNNIVTPLELFFLIPFSNPLWKYILGLQIRGRMLDEWISNSRLLQNFAFMHFFILQKPKQGMDKNNPMDDN